MAADLLSVITTQTLVAAFALILAIGSLVRLIFFEPKSPFGPMGSPPGPGVDIPVLTDTVLTIVLFALSIVSIYNLLKLRGGYARLLLLAEKVGR